ncbi:hypothetical protein DL93DRAFT_2124049 [Clavulina sp. PMI_390]|nr:hypothetical protein DL93DRAFT_2124049 [Clavulina sp. PMI_390]
MASYAAITKENREPLSEQPHPDTALLNTEPPAPGETSLPDGDSSKITVAPAGWKEEPKYVADQIREETERAKAAMSDAINNSASSGPSKRDKAKATADKAEKEGLELWEQAQRVLLQPGVAGGILGLVNVGLIGTISYKLYTEPGLRSDQRFLGTAGASALAIFGAEGWFAEAYRKTEAGQREEAKAREEGAAVYKHAKEVVLRPGVLGGLVGALNVGILGGVGYWSWINWDRPHAWDRRTVSTATVGLLALFAGEGYLGEQYREKELPKHK